MHKRPRTNRLSFSYTQPLVRGRKTDDTRRQIEIARKNLTLTDVQFRQHATDVITRVEQAYWELVHALKSLQVQTEAVKQTRAQVETNKRQVARGVLAPIDVVEAEAQVKIYEQNVYAAQEEVTRAENSLKTLMLPDRSAQLWSRALLPVTPVKLEAPRMFLGDAINTALENRFELAELRTNKDINEINKRFYRDQTKPQVDLQVSYSSNGYAGTLTDNENPILTGFTSLEKTDEPQSAADLLKQTRERWRISLFGDRLHVVVDATSEIEGLIKELGAANISVLDAYEMPYSLEDVFISVVEKARRR